MVISHLGLRWVEDPSEESLRLGVFLFRVGFLLVSLQTHPENGVPTPNKACFFFETRRPFCLSLVGQRADRFGDSRLLPATLAGNELEVALGRFVFYPFPFLEPSFHWIQFRPNHLLLPFAFSKRRLRPCFLFLTN